MEVLIFLLFLLAIITVVGHLIWLAVAALLRWLRNNPKPDSWPSHSYDPPVNGAGDLDTTERQIVKFYSEGRLNEETYEELMKQIRVERAGFARLGPTPPI